MSNNAQKRSTKHRLRKDDLVMKIFYFFSELYEQSSEESIWDVQVPIAEIRRYLSQRYEVNYNSDQWVLTQLRRYEDEIGVPLFRKVSGEESGGGRESTGAGGASLAMHDEMVQFYQKKHLYVSQKIKVANGVYDLIRHEMSGTQKPVTVLLGAGSTVYHLADILAEKSWEDELRYAIYTHNLGSLQTLLNHNVNYRNITVSILSGTIDPVTYTIVGDDIELFAKTPFDYIVQGTSCVHEGRLYIESHEELKVKRAILERCSGVKVLVLTKHEFQDKPIPDIEPYGHVKDYDYVVLPRSTMAGRRAAKPYEERLEKHLSMFETAIMNWNYLIYRVV